MKSNTCFIDTSAFIGLNHSSDQNHQSAVNIAAHLTGYTYYLSEAVLNETYTILRYRLGYQTARRFLSAVNEDPEHFTVVEVSERIRKETVALLDNYSNHPISYCDAQSVAVMKDMGLKKIFAFDHHFEMMGVQRLYE
ncbi:type II toxin-antitoxin system VapC family toxin [Salibacterium salarium]|uniref:type II toxin-antitoxin system VapC family toxin n=1 Tax=Salibacterium salarium TaxID=284579 RepID=UPI00163A79C6|nr:PIN domain-containing protein [Salibacterium salarium]